MESIESVNNGIKCCCVHVGKRVRRDKKEKVRRREKGGKRKTNKDEKRGWHPNMQPSVFSS